MTKEQKDAMQKLMDGGMSKEEATAKVMKTPAAKEEEIIDTENSEEEVVEEETEVAEEELQSELKESGSVTAKDNSWFVKIIQPGWGSSGYYSEELLEASAGMFAKGTKMYVNHSESGANRSVKDLAGVFKSDATYMNDGPDGAGLYTEVEVFNSFSPYLEEIAPHIGVSIFASGIAEAGEAEGKQGPIIKEFSKVLATDFVDRPGAGGKILAKLNEARDEIVSLNKQVKESDARVFCVESLSSIKLPETSKNAITVAVVEAATADKDLKETYEVALNEQLDMIKEIEKDKSPVKGIDESTDNNDKPSIEESQTRLTSVFKSMGLSEAAAELAAKGRE